MSHELKERLNTFSIIEKYILHKELTGLRGTKKNIDTPRGENEKGVYLQKDGNIVPGFQENRLLSLISEVVDSDDYFCGISMKHDFVRTFAFHLKGGYYDCSRSRRIDKIT